MRIRLRDGVGNTHRVEVTELCDLRTLRDRISAVTGISLSAIHVSLNRREEISGTPGTLLSSFGICSGDLLYLIIASPAPNATPQEVQREVITSSPSVADSRARLSQEELLQIRRDRCAVAAERRSHHTGLQSNELPVLEVNAIGSVSMNTASEQPYSNPESVVSAGDNMNADLQQFTEGTVPPASGAPLREEAASARESAPKERLEGFPASVLRVLTLEAPGLETKSPSDVLVVVVHAIMIESGLTLKLQTDPLSSQQFCSLPPGWSSTQRPLTLSYGLEMASTVSCTLRFQTVGGFLLIYGTMDSGARVASSDVYRLSLRVADYCSQIGVTGNLHQLSKKMRELLVEIKDKLSLPLLSALCQQTGLQPPLSLLLLPSEAKLLILQSLPAASLAACACTCVELRHLSLEDSLWRSLYQNDFGALPGTSQGNCNWRERYISKSQKEKQLAEERRQAQARAHIWMGPPPMAPAPFPFQPAPGIIGGDYDLFPLVGGGIDGLNGPGFGPGGFLGPRGGGWGQGAREDNLMDNPLGGRALREVGDLPANPPSLRGTRGGRGRFTGMPSRNLHPSF